MHVCLCVWSSECSVMYIDRIDPMLDRLDAMHASRRRNGTFSERVEGAGRRAEARNRPHNNNHLLPRLNVATRDRCDQSGTAPGAVLRQHQVEADLRLHVLPYPLDHQVVELRVEAVHGAIDAHLNTHTNELNRDLC